MQFVLLIMSFDIEILTVEFVKLADGHHEMDIDLDKSFFEHYQNSDVLNAQLKVEIDIEKTGNMMIVDLLTIGHIEFPCDRCLKDLAVPVDVDFKVIYHLNSEHITEIEVVNDLDTDVVYLTPQEYKVNLSQVIYESSLLAIPMIKNCDDYEGNECDELMIDKINRIQSEDLTDKVDPRWEKLKTILKNEE